MTQANIIHPSLDDRQSALIRAMRFPLICLVVFAHSAGSFAPPTLRWSLEGENVFHFVAEMLSRHLCSIGTCWFFVFSGYLFFRYLQDGDFGLPWVLAKWKKRVRSLLVPYLVWNALAVLAVWFVGAVYSRIPSLPAQGDTIPMNPLYWFFTGPADFPLWFMRDLMLLSLVAPAAHLLFRKYPLLSLVLLFMLYLSPWNPAIPTMRSIFFFGAGVWLGTQKTNMLSLCRTVKIPAAVLSVILLLAATSQVGRASHTLLLRLFYPFGMISFMNACDLFLNSQERFDKLERLSGSVFFIYAAHEIYILGWTKGLLLRLFGESMPAVWLRYFLVPVVVTMVCLALYFLLNWLIPQTMAFICGGRTQKQHSNGR